MGLYKVHPRLAIHLKYGQKKCPDFVRFNFFFFDKRTLSTIKKMCFVTLQTSRKEEKKKSKNILSFYKERETMA